MEGKSETCKIWIQGYIAGRENQLQGQGQEMETNEA